MKPKKIRLGDLLIANKVISQEQLNTALADQKKSGRKLGRVLVENGFLSEDQLLTFLSQQLNIPYIDLRRYHYKPEVVRLIPEAYARRFRAIVLEDSRENLLVGMADPTDIFAYDELSRVLDRRGGIQQRRQTDSVADDELRRPLRLAVVKESELLKTIDRVYRRTEEISDLAQELHQELTAQGGVDLATLAETEGLTDAPVVKLLQSMFEDAVQVNASDIHIEPDEKELRIRFRLDGVLRVQTIADRRIASALVSRVKLMANLDISEKRLPQDGRTNIRIRDKNIDVRISTMPVQFGESVVMRLLNPFAGVLSLEQVGMPKNLLERFRRLIHNPNGMVLVTGPTGSGKTTTLYAALSELNRPEFKILTVEDPVEYRLAGINQVQVNSRIELTFARVLRSMLRQDPDIILVGEMRDQETAEIGLRAAMTGHLVLSTLHTNDAISTALRLIDMGVEPFMAAASLRGIISQRLVRRICESCAEPYELPAAQMAIVRAEAGDKAETLKFKRGRGCTHCNGTGYSGRIGVFEYLEMDSTLVEALHTGDPMKFAAAAKSQPGFQALRRAAIILAAQGLTTMDQVARATFSMEE
ncbi:MAG: MSHA biogenesis protein MshE [Candidatus Muproteobacteria bacterium RIFCSPHIGHO2_12_FULL_60_33]|uniref:MSHA biogenesis protein MshE n=1 Tax=Candidatus Muproteobacteria bacterium RIFCSPLOWO2_01_FULL_60_18 TaxID=1817768 RepID=A0A1F6U348_9PROT|nr:MAG: MSHA biogenesis protein MshE [Candidatus Muproteobacteria bacterium RIFCSPHIGHO2_01_60_12]OGI51770.1 MAG: MSHA biogenesis protein MshE [Candidatus Muproteobacteria bacterium RIFCSPLOWO2_01_FULL_60_18]OGI55219.1 MAG: MSHA biogenesis protein MshE [Candidatus Muproteobacteria bacterium RIFCSPHIGHO2_02_FULL_60_13]OGI55853.1 MAG: MSHA biogenesis protein MshE [Candidatus Muproteobacteria bacterium RIFCSPHIGHO2_12_FULL_60_33]OGI58428.1 MAG: MSHA biogenesis protein MshE [Candidatus Muproteobact